VPRARHPGFTLVELLVVVGIIAILIAILLPTLNQARKKAQAVACASNMRQIYIACLMFTQEHKGHLPRPHQAQELSSNAAALKVCVWLHLKVDAAGHADLRDDMGALWRYFNAGEAGREQLITCPGDTGELAYGSKVSDQYPRNYSYSMNYLVASPGDAARRPGGTPFKLGIRIDGIKQPSKKIMWYEELAPADTWNLTQIDFADNPSARHGKDVPIDARLNPQRREYNQGGRGNFCFFDGHVESMSPQEVMDPRNSNLHRPLMEGDW
jgi:prepilin-type N-terminal cleavage/methylation domain-containing protein/prepilin-type processing-associated H-X9-DG protein